MEAEGCSDRAVRAERLQPARCYTRESLLVCKPFSRLMSARLRRVVCEHLGSPELEAPRLAAVSRRGEAQVPADSARPRSQWQPELATQDEPVGQSSCPYLEPIGSASLCTSILVTMQRSMSDSSQGVLADGERNWFDR